MDELIDILDETGKRTGNSSLKSDAHRLGLFHPTVHVWLCNTKGEILFQKRGKNKKTFPDLWDVSVAGHIAFNETYENAALREVAEEIGIQLKKEQLTKIGERSSKATHPNGLIDHELHHVYVVTIDHDINQFIPRQNEVAALQFIGINVFKDMIHDEEKMKMFVPMQNNYYSWIVEKIETHL